MTIGSFDGLHRGHQLLLEKVVRAGPLPTVISFKRNPKSILQPRTYGGDILSLSQKLSLFEGMGVALTVLIDFSGNFSKLSGREFIDLLRDRGHLRYLVIGADFRCGYRLDTDAALIKKMNDAAGIPTEVAAPLLEGSLPISSSRIRSAISAGRLAEAAALLGRNVEIDLSGLSPGPGGMFFDAAARGRIIPPPGRYPALFYAAGSPGGVRTEISIENGAVFVPAHVDAAPFGAGRVELISGPY
jgi:riboflavin kinase/FMN adenylyltransferase